MKSLTTLEMRNMITEHKLKELICKEAGVARGIEFQLATRYSAIFDTFLYTRDYKDGRRDPELLEFVQSLSTLSLMRTRIWCGSA